MTFSLTENTKTMPLESDFLPIEMALDALHRTTGLKADVARKTMHADLEMTIQANDGQVYSWMCEMKPNVDRRDQLLTFKHKHHDKVMITRALSAFMAAQCRELDIQFIDYSGNCFLRQGSLLVYVFGAKEETRDKVSVPRGLTPAVLQVVLAVLTQPDILNTNIRAIAQMASISRGAAAAALNTLVALGFLSISTTGRRLVVMPQRWLDAWTEGYLGRIRPKLQKMRMRSPHSVANLLELIGPKMGEFVWGGEAAAHKLSLGIKPEMLTLYVKFTEPQVLSNAVKEYKLRRDPDGPIELVDLFWNAIELQSFPTVPDALIYADLIGAGDTRSLEIANTLRKAICRHVESKA